MEKNNKKEEKARDGIRLCLILVVTIAIVLGVTYYFYDVKGGEVISEGTLVWNEGGCI